MLTPLDIQNKEFKRVFSGYSMQEVDEFLNLVIDGYEKLYKENMDCKILSYKGKVFGVEPPTFVTLQVVETEPGVKGNTATNVQKNAVVETGASIKVPIFINEGDMIESFEIVQVKKKL